MVCKMVGGTKVPWNERSGERKFPGMNGILGTKVPHRDYSFLGMKAWARKVPIPPVLYVLCVCVLPESRQMNVQLCSAL